jgi:hypothetical protein
MLESFTFEFAGFNGCPSRCHIRILGDASKPVMVIVSQVISPAAPGVHVVIAMK